MAYKEEVKKPKVDRGSEIPKDIWEEAVRFVNPKQEFDRLPLRHSVPFEELFNSNTEINKNDNKIGEG